MCGPHLFKSLSKEVIGTFAGHPFVMASMNAFLKWPLWLQLSAAFDLFVVRLETPETTKSYDVMPQP